MEKVHLTQSQCRLAVKEMAIHLRRALPNTPRKIYGIPRGGIPVAYMLCGEFEWCEVVDDPGQADFFVDDLADSGATRARYLHRWPEIPFFTLGDFLTPQGKPDGWLVFPWEVTEVGEDKSGEDIVIRLLQHIGEDVSRGGLRETPKRVLKAWKEWTSGYSSDAKQLQKCFEDGAENYDEMVLVKDLPFYSHCEHHLAPFFGTVTVAYIPNKRIVGLSKLGRVTEVFAKRLQVQERLTTDIATALQEGLEPKGVGVIVKARHLCMESRGLAKQGHTTTTSKLLGIFKEERVRNEFFSLATS